MTRDFSPRGRATRAHQEVVAWYRQPRVDELAGLSEAQRYTLQSTGELAVQVAIDALDRAGVQQLSDMHSYNDFIDEPHDPSRGTRWSALVDMLEAPQNLHRARAALRETQRHLGRALSQHVAHLSLDPEIVLPAVAALYVPPEGGQSSLDLWLPNKTIAMPSGLDEDGSFHPLSSFSAEQPQPPDRSFTPVCR